ncbi:MAG TPA: endolytic transglycosylase MltG [Sedimenticola thiotaurini]|uniref:Endolytic murein transglycosylase n=1 Tax=Sedimenticola thiotaurini TaxID=1543721 RepID=A0A831RLH3_9GAMM|nr:endolytic transglycosylase MltG [Sedimenticola thiotaurini]
MLNRILGILLILTSLAAAWAMMEYRRFIDTPLRLPPEGALVTVAQGSSLAGLSRQLAQQGYLQDPLYLRLLARWDGTASRIQAGEYRIPAGTRPRELLALLVAGRVTSYSLTLVEGWTFRQVMEAVNGSDALNHTLAGLTPEQIMERLGHPGEHPEGRFLPDTYRFPRGTTDLAFLARAYGAMERLLAREWQRRAPDLPLKTPYQALILASIVEKETGRADERPEIAGVFIRRLRKGMKLQTDPTVIYGMGDAYKGNIRRRDLQQDTPYNTYVHRGLPPTPICMPGADAIRATLHPNGGDALYFVARGDGSHEFSSTLKAHNRAVRKYQLKR